MNCFFNNTTAAADWIYRALKVVFKFVFLDG